MQALMAFKEASVKFASGSTNAMHEHRILGTNDDIDVRGRAHGMMSADVTSTALDMYLSYGVLGKTMADFEKLPYFSGPKQL